MDEILKQLKIKADVVGVEQNGTVARFLLKLQPGAKLDKLEKCSTEIALGMKSYGKPIIKPITEKGLVSVEFITKVQDIVAFDELLSKIDDSSDLPIIVGRTLFGDDLVLDLVKMPHLLIAGSTGSGKSILLHSIVSSLISNEKDIELVLVDPKTVELTYYENVKNLVCPIITDPDTALKMLGELVDEMNHRFKLLAKKKVNSIKEYNKKAIKKLSYIVLVIDEFSDLMYSVKKDFQKLLCILAQKSRACGIHIVIATQRPSVDVITGSIKTNFPTRISFRVPSGTDSRVVLDVVGAEKLLGNGDGLIVSPQHDLVRFKGAYLSPAQIEEIAAENKIGFIDKIIRKIL